MARSPKKPKQQPALPPEPLDSRQLALTLHQTIIHQLPDMLTGALAVYNHIRTLPQQEDQQAFTANQYAAKAALGHIDALVRLIAILQREQQQMQPASADQPSADGQAVVALLAMARQALDQQ